ncbi:transketolase [Clostridium saccharobutylicum]|uniref:Putative transketolase N-terminal section n=1 Tax=Clostridium saccharobutylicum DSM 13864 TaxID=1345695 RepID=U5MZ48_CLOSA|nr:transketolase [Clostridium saccharobutylicum]AGX44797.1 putative transketolase N-terminal section [Clostridium saccharobutylicum DSM 13864]AQR92083.1 transketolase 2 [Clostridium saccharobutylicum]AQS01985.1 transketolase 2 [Clostridium saccharobutylicum]AQS11589.1 transketolase 2 [Clostridium saccharobutylicum]AQS15968.1 transketolase 2 [Clostridium saccharobutylicum]
MNKEKLISISKEVKKDIVEMIYEAKSGHPGGSLSCSDIITYLYNEKMNVDVNNPKDPNRDRFVLSKGHAAPAIYSVLAEKGYFPKEELNKLRKVGALLQGHPDSKHVPGVDVSTGSLGQGISNAVGMALGLRAQGNNAKVYVVLGDGELQEGLVWEASMAAAHYKLDNLIAIIDNNGLQIDGKNEEVMGISPLDKKFESFGWNVIVCEDGNDFDSIHEAFSKVDEVKEKPSVIIAKTVKGKGVSFMENNAGWHGQAPNEEEKNKALSELER